MIIERSGRNHSPHSWNYTTLFNFNVIGNFSWNASEFPLPVLKRPEFVSVSTYFLLDSTSVVPVIT